MIVTDDILKAMGFYQVDKYRWQHEKYYPKYSLWLSTARGYPKVSDVIGSIVEKARILELDNFKRDVIAMFTIKED